MTDFADFRATNGFIRPCGNIFFATIRAMNGQASRPNNGGRFNDTGRRSHTSGVRKDSRQYMHGQSSAALNGKDPCLPWLQIEANTPDNAIALLAHVMEDWVKLIAIGVQDLRTHDGERHHHPHGSP
jgi:hypothetical protein